VGENVPGRCELVLYRRRVRPLLPRLFAALAAFAAGVYAGGLW